MNGNLRADKKKCLAQFLKVDVVAILLIILMYPILPNSLIHHILQSISLNVVGEINCLASTAFDPCGRPNPFSKFVTLIHVIFLDRLMLISPDSFNYFFQFFMS